MGRLLRVWVQKDFELFLDIPPLARHHLTVFNSTRVAHAISLWADRGSELSFI